MSDGQELPEEYKKKELAAWNYKDFCERDFYNSGKTVNQAINIGINFLAFPCKGCQQQNCIRR